MMGSTVLASGRKMSFREAGTGPVLVQVHGIGTGHHNFDLLTPHLTSFHVNDVDLPGYGASEDLHGGRTIGALADAVADFIGQRSERPILLHGTSFGGLVAMSLTARFPELVDRLVVTCSFARLDNAMRAMQRSWQSAARASASLLAEVTSIQGFSRSFWDRPDATSIQEAFVNAMASSSPDDFLRDLPLMEHVDLTDVVAQISRPTLLIGAADDQMTPVQTAASGAGMTDLVRLIPGAELHVLSDCGHFISIERAAETAQVMTTFLLEG